MEDGKFEMWKKQFGLHVDENGLLRCKGRLGNVDLPVPTSHPVLLCKKHPLTSLIVREAHERVMHNGVKETLTEICTKYWIVKGRQVVKRMIHKCVLCRRFDCPPYHAPSPPPLPEFRVNTRSTLLKRPLKCLYPLEVTCGDSASSAADHPVEPEPQRLPEEIPVRRSSRITAKRARDRPAWLN